jgi:hypothetical protein
MAKIKNPLSEAKKQHTLIYTERKNLEDGFTHVVRNIKLKNKK